MKDKEEKKETKASEEPQSDTEMVKVSSITGDKEKREKRIRK